MNTVFCIVGTGTNVGKTWLVSLLAQHYLTQGRSVSVVKCVQTGPDSDASVVASRVPGVVVKTLFHFSTPVSPHLAAEIDHGAVDESVLTAEIESSRSTFDVTLVEGSGGLFSPVTRSQTFAELSLCRKYPVVLTASNQLGALHTVISTIQAAKFHHIAIAAIILMDDVTDPEGPEYADNPVMLSHYGGGPVIRLPRQVSFADAVRDSSASGRFNGPPFIIPKL